MNVFVAMCSVSMCHLSASFIFSVVLCDQTRGCLVEKHVQGMTEAL